MQKIKKHFEKWYPAYQFLIVVILFIAFFLGATFWITYLHRETIQLQQARTDYTTYSETESPQFYKIRGTANFNDEENNALEQTGTYKAENQSGIVITSSTIEYGKRERENLTDKSPKGWITYNPKVSVTFANNKAYTGFFWNKSHLVAHMLGGEDETDNLITGTRAQNVGDNSGNGGMQYAEFLVYNYWQEHQDVTIKYLATAIYKKNEQIPRSVIVDILSSDEQLNQEIEVYNVMPNYDINYNTGKVKKKHL